MSREQFGPMGALLDERELALALAAIGVLYQRGDVDSGLAGLLAATDSGFSERVTAEHGRVLEVPVRLRALQAYIRDSRAWQASKGAPMPWQNLQVRFNSLVSPGARVRFRIDLAGSAAAPDTKLDVSWLARMLGTPAFDAYGVYVSQPIPELALTWEWPLRIGIPRDAASGEFRDALAAGRYRALYEMADVEGGAACDLLLIPAGLRDATRIAGRLAVRSSAAIVVGGTTDSARDTEAMLRALRERLNVGAVAIAHVPSAERACWFDALLAEIAHNGTLDMALMLASRVRSRSHFRGASGEGFDGDLTPPLVEADRSFIARAVLDGIARRVGLAARGLPQADTAVGLDRSFSGLATAGPGATIRTVAEQLATSAERVAWHHETGDAMFLADFRRRIEGITSAPLVLPPLVIGMPLSRMTRGAPSPAMAPQPEPAVRGPRAKPPVAAAPPPEPLPRSVLVDLSVQSPSGEWTRTEGKLTAGATCALDTFIGLPREGVVTSPEAIDEKSLPPSATGHVLTIAFTPLWRGPDREFAPAQTIPVHLPPPTGDSRHATFYFTAPPSLTLFRARIIVLFGFRVVQTLILDAPAGALRLEVENRVSHDFGDRSEAPPFEAALIVNDNPQGIPGITTLAADGATFIEPAGLDTLVASIRKQLKVLNLEDAAPDLEDDAVESLLRTLAAYGAELTRKLKNQPQMSAVLGVKRLQVVDARQGAYLPVEFFYDGKSPLPSARRCENSVAALGNLDVHAQCAHNRDANYFCPAAFWGFSRCLERQPFGGRGVTVFRQPQPGANTLRPLEKVLLAASQKVRKEDVDPPAGIETILRGAAASVSRADSWMDWQSKVTGESPSLLVLLPHSLDSPDFPGMPALEISGTNLASANVESDLVTSSPERTPVVLLLGCSTALPEIPFLNFVGQFKDSGAALVIGTIATIRGRQVGAFVRALLAELSSATAAGGGTFDEVFLRVKQRLLAAGDPFVLSLMAYGDTGWRIQV